MSKTLAEVTHDAAELPQTDRLKLARILLDISPSKPEPSADIQNAWDTEIQRRLQDLRSGKVKGIPLQETKRKIEKRFP
jgi:putative addiction module component (TIGR02574 family)